MGVKFKTGVEVGKDISLDKLREQGFKAFYLAVGASKGTKVGCPGDDMTGAFTGIDFLREVNLGEKPAIGKSVAVIGGGNVVTGPKFAIDAIAAGKEGAVSIHRYVHPGQSQVIGRDRRDYKAMNTATAGISVAGFDTAPRQHAADGSAKEAKKTFKDLRGTFTEEQMKIETSRCLGCGVAVVDESLCVGCGICTTKCKFDAIHLEKVTDYVGAPYFKALLGAAGNAPAAVAKLVTKKIARK